MCNRILIFANFLLVLIEMLHDLLSALLVVSGDFLYCDPAGQFQVTCLNVFYLHEFIVFQFFLIHVIFLLT